jgi:hypothetical protein
LLKNITLPTRLLHQTAYKKNGSSQTSGGKIIM